MSFTLSEVLSWGVSLLLTTISVQKNIEQRGDIQILEAEKAEKEAVIDSSVFKIRKLEQERIALTAAKDSVIHEKSANFEKEIEKKNEKLVALGTTVNQVTAQAEVLRDEYRDELHLDHRNFARSVNQLFGNDAVNEQEKAAAFDKALLDEQANKIKQLEHQLAATKQERVDLLEREDVLTDSLARKDKTLTQETKRAEDEVIAKGKLKVKLEQELRQTNDDLSATGMLRNVLGGGATLTTLLAGFTGMRWRRRGGDTAQYRNAIQQFLNQSGTGNNELIKSLMSQGCRMIPEQYLMGNQSALKDDPPAPGGEATNGFDVPGSVG